MSAPSARARKQKAAAQVAAIRTASAALGFCTDCGKWCRGRVLGDIEQNIACRSVIICDPCDQAMHARHEKMAREDRELIKRSRRSTD